MHHKIRKIERVQGEPINKIRTIGTTIASATGLKAIAHIGLNFMLKERISFPGR
jgi:hypothetical protein